MFLTDSTSDNSGHTATLYSAQICSAITPQTSHIPKTLYDILSLRIITF